MAERKPLSRRLRFEIFKRDGFRCTYCGAAPIERPLHVDHVKPVVDGGTDEPHNLVTSCGDCNLGKNRVPLHKKKLAVGKVTEADLDHAEQIREYLAIQRDVAESRTALQDQLLEEWEARCGSPPRQLRSRIVGMVTEFGIERLLEAFDIVAAKELRYETTQLKYLHGVLKRWRQDAGPVPAPEKTERPRTKRCRMAVAAAVDEMKARLEEFGSYDEMLGHVSAAFALAAGASSKDVETYYSDGDAVGWEAENGGIKVHGILLRPETKDGRIWWHIDEVENYDPFREACLELFRDIHNRLSYAVSWKNHCRETGQEDDTDLEREIERFLEESYLPLRRWIEKYREEDLGEAVEKSGEGD